MMMLRFCRLGGAARRRSTAEHRFQCYAITKTSRSERRANLPLAAFRRRIDMALEHDPEKCGAVFRKDHAPTKT
jgi:hypothetical protein